MNIRLRKLLPWTISVALFYLEVIFKFSTTGGLWPSIVAIALFSLALGQLAYLAIGVSTNRHVRHGLTLALLAALGVLFGVEYFIYRQFKVLYDVKTVTLGAADATGQFGGTIQALVFSPAGIAHVALFLLPAALYARQMHHWRGRPARTHDLPLRKRATIGGVALASYALALVLVANGGSWGQAYASRYSFQNAATNFGLMTGLIKDLQLGGNAAMEFSAAGAADADSGDAAQADPRSAVDTSPNVMDIDFSALDQSNGTYAQLDAYVQSLTPSDKNQMTGRFEGYNLIFVSAEAFCAEAIRPDTTPTLYRMANRGIQFTDYYQFDSAGTTGGECANLFGLLATEGGASVKNTASHNNYLTMGNQLNRLGYRGWAFHNNTYTFYSRDLTHNNLGYSNGFMGYGSGMEQWVDWQWPQSDVQMVEGTFDNLYGSSSPFNVYYMSVSGHSDYSYAGNAMAQKNWSAVEGLDCSEPVKAYLASQVEFDRAMESLVGRLEDAGIAKKTLVVIAADHFPYGLDDDGPLGSLPYLSELYGYDVQNYLQRDHNRLIMWSASLEDEEPIVVSEPTSAIDILPTLSNLFGVEWDSRLLPGRDVFSDAEAIAFDLNYDWKTSKGSYLAATGEFVPAEGVEVEDGYVERIHAIVADKITYCKGVLQTDYYRHVFGD